MSIYNNVSDINQNEIYKIIDDYIHKKTPNILDAREAILFLNKLINFMEKNNLSIDPDFIVEIMENNKSFHDLVEIIFNQYASLITKGKLDQTFDSETMKIIIEAYCILEKIMIEEDDATEDIDSSEYTDHMKLYLKVKRFIVILLYHLLKNILMQILFQILELMHYKISLRKTILDIGKEKQIL